MARILVIEDNLVNLELMTYLLDAWGHEVLVAPDGEAGLALARRERPDLVVCDIQMPGLDGYGVARAMKADPGLAAIPVMALSAYAMVGDSDKSFQAGFDAHFTKPIDPAAFMEALGPFLPESAAAPQPAPAAAAAPSVSVQPIGAEFRAPGPGLTVLLADDTAANLEYKASLLEPAGYRVLSADGGESALALLRREHVDLILSDVHMADGDGFALLAQVRADAATRAIPFVFLTATARDSVSRARGLALGADAYLLRPIDPELLLAEIRARLRGR